MSQDDAILLARELVEAHFADVIGQPITCEPLPGERDLNVKVIGPQRMAVLKIHQPGQGDWLDLQDRALHAVTAAGLPGPAPLHAQAVALPDGRVVRLVEIGRAHV